MRSFLGLLLIFFVLGIGSCNKNKQKAKFKPAIYFWKTLFELSENEKRFLKENQIQKIYLRFFDVDRQFNEIVPKATIHFKEIPEITIVPTVFFTNNVFININSKQTEKLVEDTRSKVMSVCEKNNLTIREIQLDCDWSEKTKEAYFKFLSIFREKMGEDFKISVTLRLHQVKFPEKTGIPPVEDAVLMFYNTGDWRVLSPENSLFEARTILKYLDDLNKYPLKLNFALPIYSQGLLYRSGIFYTFIKNLDDRAVLNSPNFRKTQNRGEYLCTKNMIFKDISFREGDILKVEKADLEGLKKIKNVFLESVNQSETEMILFHLDQNISYDKNQFSEILQGN
jgi:hypothetical protein